MNVNEFVNNLKELKYTNNELIIFKELGFEENLIKREVNNFIFKEKEDYNPIMELPYDIVNIGKKYEDIEAKSYFDIYFLEEILTDDTYYCFADYDSDLIAINSLTHGITLLRQDGTKMYDYDCVAANESCFLDAFYYYIKFYRETEFTDYKKDAILSKKYKYKSEKITELAGGEKYKDFWDFIINSKDN